MKQNKTASGYQDTRGFEQMDLSGPVDRCRPPCMGNLCLLLVVVRLRMYVWAVVLWCDPVMPRAARAICVSSPKAEAHESRAACALRQVDGAFD